LILILLASIEVCSSVFYREGMFYFSYYIDLFFKLDIFMEKNVQCFYNLYLYSSK
jgi:hypothetical protein